MTAFETQYQTFWTQLNKSNALISSDDRDKIDSALKCSFLIPVSKKPTGYNLFAIQKTNELKKTALPANQRSKVISGLWKQLPINEQNIWIAKAGGKLKPTSTQTSTPAPIQTPTPTPIQTPTPAPIQTPTPAPIQTPAPVPIKAKIVLPLKSEKKVVQTKIEPIKVEIKPEPIQTKIEEIKPEPIQTKIELVKKSIALKVKST